MENKLKELESLENIEYDRYEKLLKDSLKEIAKTGAAIEFALVDGVVLPWKDATVEEKEMQPFLYLGDLTRWKTELRAADLELEEYSYGVCKVVQVGKNMHVYMVPEKGKATETRHLKLLQKGFKKHRPKVFLEVVADLDKVETTAVETAIDDNMDMETEFKELGKELYKYHVLTVKIREAMETADIAQGQRLKIKFKHILNRLKDLCISWEEDIVPHQEVLVQGEDAEIWVRIYEKWSAYFEKLQAAKEGRTQDQEALKLAEERLYTKTLEDLEQLFAGIENSSLLDPSVIETELQNLHTHVENWKEFIADKESQYIAELEAVEAQMESLDQEWSKFRPYVENYYEASLELEEAIIANNQSDVEQLTARVVAIEQQIYNL